MAAMSSGANFNVFASGFPARQSALCDGGPGGRTARRECPGAAPQPAGTPAKPPAALSSALRRCLESAPISIKCWMTSLSHRTPLASIEELPVVPFALADLLKGSGSNAAAARRRRRQCRQPGDPAGRGILRRPGTARAWRSVCRAGAEASGAAVMVTDRTPESDPGHPGRRRRRCARRLCARGRAAVCAAARTRSSVSPAPMASPRSFRSCARSGRRRASTPRASARSASKRRGPGAPAN